MGIRGLSCAQLCVGSAQSGAVPNCAVKKKTGQGMLAKHSLAWLRTFMRTRKIRILTVCTKTESTVLIIKGGKVFFVQKQSGHLRGVVVRNLRLHTPSPARPIGQTRATAVYLAAEAAAVAAAAVVAVEAAAVGEAAAVAGVVAAVAAAAAVAAGTAAVAFPAQPMIRSRKQKTKKHELESGGRHETVRASHG